MRTCMAENTKLRVHRTFVSTEPRVRDVGRVQAASMCAGSAPCQFCLLLRSFLLLPQLQLTPISNAYFQMAPASPVTVQLTSAPTAQAQMTMENNHHSANTLLQLVMTPNLTRDRVMTRTASSSSSSSELISEGWQRARLLRAHWRRRDAAEYSARRL